MKIFQFLFAGLMILGFMSCDPDEAIESGGDLQLQVSAEFSGSPFFINKEYSFPDGRKVRFSRLDFYVSDFVLKDLSKENGIISDVVEVGFIDLSSSEVNQLDPLETQINALNIPAGNYTNLNFTLGLTDELNAKTPTDADIGSNNPLSKTSHYWEDWSSYIFMRVEGSADFNDDGTIAGDETFIYHTGKSGNEKRVNLATAINITAENLTEVEVGLDLVKFFYNDSDEARFDMSVDRSVHNSSGLETIDKIMSGAAASFKVK